MKNILTLTLTLVGCAAAWGQAGLDTSAAKHFIDPDTALSKIIPADETATQAFVPAKNTDRTVFYTEVIKYLLPLGFQYRGYEADQQEVYLNGLLMNDLANGLPVSGGGINEVLRPEVYPGLKPVRAGAGRLSGTVILEQAASDNSKGANFVYQHGNRSFQNRVMLAYHTGKMNYGWALSFAASADLARKGYRQGTFKEDVSWYLDLSRQLTQKSVVHFFILGGQNRAGGASPATQEVYDLAGTHFYNASWGYQQGVVRNASINSSLRSLYALRYQYNHQDRIKASVSIAFRHGYGEHSGLDAFNAPDPRPDYYKKLPSYYLNNPASRDERLAEDLRQQWLQKESSRQIDWDNLYAVNRLNFDVVNGIAGRRAAYALGADREDPLRFDLAASLQAILSDHVQYSAGLVLSAQQAAHYCKMKDLLGGDYYVNVDPFVEQSFEQSDSLKQIDLQHPDQLIWVGDKYGCNYICRYAQGFLHSSVQCTYGKTDLFIGGRLGYDGYGREGLYRNGLFPDSSFGRSRWSEFLTYQVKGGATYRICERHYIFANGMLMRAAPRMADVFIAPEIRNSIVPGVVAESISSFEAGYVIRTAAWHISLTAFAAAVKDRTSIRRFYYESDNTFVHYVMQHIHIRHSGLELALQVKVLPSLTATAVAAWMQVFYSDNPRGSLYPDLDTGTRVVQHTVYLKNYNVASGPQSALSFGLNYSPGYSLQAGIRFNVLDKNYVAVNPLRHTDKAMEFLVAGTPSYQEVLRQERLPSASTVDLFVGKRFMLGLSRKKSHRGTFLNVAVNAANILNRQDHRISGYDQMRYDEPEANPGLFPPKYTYAVGANYVLSCRLEF